MGHVIDLLHGDNTWPKKKKLSLFQFSFEGGGRRLYLLAFCDSFIRQGIKDLSDGKAVAALYDALPHYCMVSPRKSNDTIIRRELTDFRCGGGGCFYPLLTCC